jgi:sugar lactone lactonase YvrE
MRVPLLVTTATCTTLLLGTAAATPPTTTRADRPHPTNGLPRIPFEARGIVALSDTDTVAQAYIDDDIGPAIDDTDTLTLIRPDGSGRRGTDVGEVPVTNSVWGPPTASAVTPDGRYAIVLEGKEQREPGDTSFEADLAFSTRISVVELRGSEPRVVQTTQTGGFAAHSLAISPSGDSVVVANWAAPGEDSGIPEGEGQQLGILPFRDGRLGEPRLFGLDNVAGPYVYPNTVAWHPSGRFLAVTIGPRNLVAFYRVRTGPDGRVDLQSWGAPVDGGRFPFPGTWSPDGRYFIAGVMQWAEPEVSDRNSPPGRLSVVRFDAERDGGVRHDVRAGATVGINPEGLAISPDGRFVVTINLRYSHLPQDFDPMRPPTTSSATLVRFDPRTGATTTIDEYTFDGVLPEGVAFDRTGEHLAVAVFDFNGAKGGRGAVQFWRLDRDGTPRLRQLDVEVPTPRGTHSLGVIR